jgi:ATP-dependent DNA ligase
VRSALRHLIPAGRRISELHVAYRAPQITFEPCIPIQADQPPSGPGWLYEIKHNGFRLIARRDGAGVRLITRNGHDWTERYPAVSNAVARLPCLSCVIDGEVVITNEAGRAVFDRLQQGPRMKPEAFLFAFDIDRTRRRRHATDAAADTQEPASEACPG